MRPATLLVIEECRRYFDEEKASKEKPQKKPQNRKVAPQQD
jgi:hypothetical protein